MNANWDGFFTPVLLAGCIVAALVSFHLFYIEKKYDVVVNIPCSEDGSVCNTIETHVPARDLP